MCLPCQVGNETMVRHCVLCEVCLQKLLQPAQGDHVSCPTCHQRFEIKELRKALKKGCLKFPLHVPPAQSCSELKNYNYEEETTVPHKRRCLSNLRRAPPIAFSPASIKENKNEYYEQIRQIMSARSPTGIDWEAHVKSLEKFTRFVDVEDVRGTWKLQYEGSSPFPTNMDAIAVGCLFPLENQHPHMPQWRKLMVNKVSNFQALMFALERRSKMMEDVVELIGILR